MGYWEERKDYIYYKVVRKWLSDFPPGGGLLDVGSADTPVATWGDFDRRVAVDLRAVEGAAQVDGRAMDFMELPGSEVYDVLTCLQVLEHLPDDVVVGFARKLLAHASLSLIVSVPYLWPEGRCASHLQDPVDRDKLVGWFGRPPDESIVVDEGSTRRLVARFSQGGWYG